MQIIKEIPQLQQNLKKIKNQKTALIPTMGALHEGHISLIQEAKKHANFIIVSIFVNKTQFNDQQDFRNYPKNHDHDLKALEKHHVDLVFIPQDQEIYPQNSNFAIKIHDLDNNLCGKTRPNHFNGVALIITKLFNIIRPNYAIFGQKDYQQLQIIKKLTQDFNFQTTIIDAPTIRNNNGLALSSRNQHLTKYQQKLAPLIYQTLQKIRTQIIKNPQNIKQTLEKHHLTLTKSGFDKIDYLTICNQETLQEITWYNQKIKTRIFIAIYLGKTRLIDNIAI